MPDERLFVRALRTHDFLDLNFELVNLRVEGKPLHLVRAEDRKPSLLIVHFPPQHVMEQAFEQNQAHTLQAGPVPIQAVLSGPSRLVFQLPDNQNDWQLTLETLLNWKAYTPVLAPNALPIGAAQGPGVAPATLGQTAIEFPTGLQLSPDMHGAWIHTAAPVEHDGRYELWHTRLDTLEKQPNGQIQIREDLERYTRAIWAGDLNEPFNPTSLTPVARSAIARLTSDFSLPEMPLRFRRMADSNEMRMLLWHRALAKKDLLAAYLPQPIYVRRLMLSALGAWANLESAWDYPVILPDRKNSDLGYPQLALEQWLHVAAQGRDQYVRTAETAFLCDLGHRVSIVTTTQREFNPLFIREEQTPQGSVQIHGATAFLRQYQTIELQERVKDYSRMSLAYSCGGRELPFQRIEITTRSTPVLEPKGIAADQAFWEPHLRENDLSNRSHPFWPRVGETPFPFQIVAEDWEARTVTFERPLLCVPLKAIQKRGDWEIIVDKYNAIDQHSRSPQTNAQMLAFTMTTAADRGKTALKTDEIEFRAQFVPDVEVRRKALPAGSPPFLPEIGSAKVGLPSVERLLGHPVSATVEFDEVYLKSGMHRTKNEGEGARGAFVSC